MSIVVRERRDADLVRLVELLVEQQAVSSYPVRWPLPVPVEEFLVRSYERRAWVAELDGAVVGHVSVGDPEELVPRFAAATGATGFGMISVLFTGLAVRRRGVGALLLDTAVDWIRGQGEVPVLDVVPVHEAAVRLYLDRGWVEIGTERFAWLGEGVPDLLLMALPPYPSASTGPSARS